MKVKKKSHKFAAILMAVAVAGSVPLGINKSLERQRYDASGSYYYDQGGYAIWEGIEKRQGAANDLVTLAKRYVDKEPSLEKYIDDMEYQVRISEMAYDNDNTFRKTAAANAALDAPAQALADALERVQLQDKDKKYPAQLIANMRSELDKMARSSYNDEAREFNAKLKRLKPMALLDPMATFDDDQPAYGEVSELVAVDDMGSVEERGESAVSTVEQAADELG